MMNHTLFIIAMILVAMALIENSTGTDGQHTKETLNSPYHCRSAKQYHINTDQFKREKYLDLRSFYKTDRNAKVTILKDRLGVEMLAIIPSLEMCIKVGRNALTYFLNGVHLHLENGDTRHYIGSKFYPAELHFVHINQKYRNESEAIKYNDGIINLAVLLEPTGEDNKALVPFIDALPQIDHPSARPSINRFNFGDILPKNKKLTFNSRPSCISCNVVFKVFFEPIKIGVNQLLRFRLLVNKFDGSSQCTQLSRNKFE